MLMLVENEDHSGMYETEATENSKHLLDIHELFKSSYRSHFKSQST